MVGSASGEEVLRTTVTATCDDHGGTEFNTGFYCRTFVRHGDKAFH